MRLFKRIVGFLMFLVGAPFTAMWAFDLLTGGNPDTTRGMLAGLLVFFGGLMGAGIRLMRAPAAPKKPALESASLEVAALRIAASSGGTLGPAQLAASAGVPFAAARKALDDLARQGACLVIVDDKGAELFRFPDLALAPGEAAGARDLLDP